MPAFGNQTSCSYPEALVLVEALPLCRILASDWPGEEVPAEFPLFDEEVEAESMLARPLRCAAVMPCAEAFALLEVVGHVGW